MSSTIGRRVWLGRCALGAASALAATSKWASGMDEPRGEQDGTCIERETRDFVLRCRRDDGSYAASPDASYTGESDTKFSDLAAVTYAAVLARTMGWRLPGPERSAAFVQDHQQTDGRFINHAGKHDPTSNLAILYNTTQGVVALRALGQQPRLDPLPSVGRLIDGDAYKKLPWYTTSFFPLLCAALDRPFPGDWRDKLSRLMVESQAEDGYLGDHVAATFHMAHYFRLLGRPTPRAGRMVSRVLRDQKPDGGWNIKQPDWDVHAAFDAVFVLRQLGGNDPAVLTAIARGADWSLSCRNPDGGFGHFPGRHSDMDAVYFQFGTLIQAGRIVVPVDLPDAHTLGWGHAMRPGRNYTS